MIFRLPCRPHEDLKWELDSLPEGQILWQFDLGLEDPYFPLEDDLCFQALALGLKRFSEEVWPRFQDRTRGAILYEGSADFSTHFSWTATQESNWELWRQQQPRAEEAHLKRLFCAESFVTYFQMLAHKLPDELPLILRLQVFPHGSLAELLHLLSPERFAHFQVELQGLPSQIDAQASQGVCFPEEWDGTVLEEIDQFLSTRSEPCRAVFEGILTEQWDGLDELYVGKISEKGKRKLAGFKAAGGKVREYCGRE
jgi:hypothetical protein